MLFATLLVVVAISGGQRCSAPDYRHWQVAYLDGENHDLYLSGGDGSQKALIAKNAAMPVWSPDGRMLAYWQGHKVFIRDFKTGKTRQLITLDGIDPTRMSFDPKHPILAIPLGEAGIKLAGLNGFDYGIYKGAHRRGMVAAAAWSRSGDKFLFTSDGDIWIGTPSIGGGDDIPAREFGRNYLTATRLAPLAFFYDTEGASASTPNWVDDVAWFPIGNRLVFHWQRQGGSGTSEIGIIDVRPHPYNDRDPVQLRHEAMSGFIVKVRWLDIKQMVFGPAVCPDGETISVTRMPPRKLDESGEFALTLLDQNGKTLKPLIKDAWDAAWRPKHENR